MIRKKDGIHIESERKFVADSRSSTGDINFVSHAHFDHMHLSEEEFLCSKETGKLAEARSGESLNYVSGAEDVSLLPAGHVLGSRAALIQGEKKTLYTGDLSVRDRLYLEGFTPEKADILVIESTYGIPNYRFPPQQEVESRIADWAEDKDQPLLLFGYSLGKAQKIQRIIGQSTGRDIYVNSTISKVNKAFREVAGLDFQAEEFDSVDELDGNSVLVLPSNQARSKRVEKIVEKTGGLKAGFSGWAVDSSFKYRGDYDETFVLSDHCGFDELVEVVEGVDPEKVYTHHGFDEAFASFVSRELGIPAQSLKKNQSTLSDF